MCKRDGLVHECQEFMVKFEITEEEKYTKNQWKSLVKTKTMQMKDSRTEFIV